MICVWCDNPKDLLTECYDNYCLRCHRYSKEVPETYTSPPDFVSQQDRWNPLGYLELHACVSKYTEVGTAVVISCINPVRAEKSSDYSYTENRCLKKFSISKEDFEDGEEKRKLTQRVHSYEWLEECRIQWAEMDARREAKKPARKPITEEEMVNHPNYGRFLELLEKGKV